MSRRLRVLHVGKFYPPHRGGMETHLQTLCEALVDEVDVSVVVAADHSRTTHETIGGVEVTRLGSLGTVRGVSIVPSLVRYLAAARADVVHVHHPNPLATMAFMRSRNPARLVVTYHSDIVRQRLLRKFYGPSLHAFLERSEAIICTSRRYAEASSVLQRHSDKCRPIPLGIDTADLIHRTADAPAIRDRAPVILAIGRLVGYKGFQHLVRAMKRTRGRLVLIGDGPLRPALERQAQLEAVADRVEFAGEVADIVPYLRAAAVVALPSVTRAEAFGLVQVEAMAAGVPVVNTSIESGVPEVSPNELTGLTVPPSDSSALADALNTLLDDRERAARYGEAGRRRAIEVYGARAMAEATLDIYRSNHRTLAIESPFRTF